MQQTGMMESFLPHSARLLIKPDTFGVWRRREVKERQIDCCRTAQKSAQKVNCPFCFRKSESWFLPRRVIGEFHETLHVKSARTLEGYSAYLGGGKIESGRAAECGRHPATRRLFQTMMLRAEWNRFGFKSLAHCLCERTK